MIDQLFLRPPKIHVKHLNKFAVLDLIRFTPDGISRAEIARQVHLSRASISSIVNDLIRQELIREARAVPTDGGRRPIMLQMNADRRVIVGVDMGATHLDVILCDLSARIIFETQLAFDIRSGPEVCLNEIDEVLQSALISKDRYQSDVLAAGVAVPGPVVAGEGKVNEPPIMPGWEDFPIRAFLESRWGFPVLLGNDAEFGALGEWAFGAGRGIRDLVYVKAGYGIGAGLLLDGKIYRGATGAAGEIGHINIDEDGPLCSCGNRGCLEAVAGGGAIARRAVEAVQAGERTRLAAKEPVQSLSARDVGEAARLGDLVAQRIVTEAGVQIGNAIASAINLFNPGLTIVGGGLSQMGDLLLEPIRQSVQQRSLRASAAHTRVTAATLGRRATSMGAVVQATTFCLYDQVSSG